MKFIKLLISPKSLPLFMLIIIIVSCNMNLHSQEFAAIDAQAVRFSNMFTSLPTPHEQTLAAKKTAFYLFREASAYYYGEPIPKLIQRGKYHGFYRHIPQFFYSQLRDVARQAVRQQPLLAKAIISSEDAYQLVDLETINDKSQRMIVLFTVIQVYENPYRYDWAVQVAVDVDYWRVLGWRVNRNPPRRGYSSAHSQLMGVNGQPRYVRAVLEPGKRLSSLRPGRMGKIYYAELGPSESDTRVYDFEEHKIYQVIPGVSGSSLDLVGTYEDWLPLPPWLRVEH